MGELLMRLFPGLDMGQSGWLWEDPRDQPWTALVDLDVRLQAAKARLGTCDGINEGIVRCHWIVVEDGAAIEPNVMLTGGPIVVRRGAVVRAGARINGPSYIGVDCVVGHATEVNRGILLDGSKCPHFAFVGHSVVGHRANLGAGVRLSNRRLDRRSVRVWISGVPVDTGMRYFGALVGDEAEVGCNAVLNPGTVLLPRATVLPLASVRGAP